MKGPSRHALTQGLTAREAKSRLAAFGPNQFGKTRRLSTFFQLLFFFANPLVIVLLVASTISFAVGNWINASIIISMVLLSVVLNFTQSWRSRVAVKRLSSQVAPKATVLRDGVWQEIGRRDVVPGDLLRFGSGDLIPADARLLEVRDLPVQQSALTGESLPVRKTGSRDGQQPDTDETSVFLGTSVISGTATAIVTATGPQTRFGEVAGQLTSRPPETEFERGTRAFGYLIARIVFVRSICHSDVAQSVSEQAEPRINIYRMCDRLPGNDNSLSSGRRSIRFCSTSGRILPLSRRRDRHISSHRRVC
jgi:P-type Mg2+ transporter